MPRSTATSRTARSTPVCPPEMSFIGASLGAFLGTFSGRFAALFLATFYAYIPSCRRKPAMAINGRRNKPFGPGGSTRRLHQRGRNRIDEGVKGVLLLGMVPPLSGQSIVANDNYAPVALAA